MDIESLTKRAEENDHEAQAILSLAYFMGTGVEVDIAKAEQLLIEASEDREAIESVLLLRR